MINMILGRKIGMTQVWDEDDNVVPVTVIQAGPCTVSQVKTEATDGYNAVQIGFGDIKSKHVNKPMAGHFAKLASSPSVTFVRSASRTARSTRSATSSLSPISRTSPRSTSSAPPRVRASRVASSAGISTAAP